MREFHFDQLLTLLLPAHVKLMLYLVGQGDDFFANVRKRTGQDQRNVWSTMCTEVGITPEQEMKLLDNLQLRFCWLWGWDCVVVVAHTNPQERARLAWACQANQRFSSGCGKAQKVA